MNYDDQNSSKHFLNNLILSAITMSLGVTTDKLTGTANNYH